VFDLNGNANTVGASGLQAFDTQAPTISVADNVPGATTNAPVTFTFTTSEAVTGFIGSDVSVAGGTVTTPFAGSGTSYSLTVTPTAATTSAITVSVGAGAFTDAAGNANATGTSGSQSYDTQAPTQTAVSFVVTDNVAPTTGTVPHSGPDTNDTQPSMVLTLSSVLGIGEEIRLFRDGGPTAVATASTGSSLSFTEPTALADGAHSYSATIVDSAGNTSALDLSPGDPLTTAFLFRITTP
jgi:hypothetical protein